MPGILPITNFPQAARFAAQCGASVPAWLRDLFSRETETTTALSAIVAAEQIRLLQSHDVAAFHFYTLNRAELCHAMARLLGAG